MTNQYSDQSYWQTVAVRNMGNYGGRPAEGRTFWLWTAHDRWESTNESRGLGATRKFDRARRRKRGELIGGVEQVDSDDEEARSFFLDPKPVYKDLFADVDANKAQMDRAKTAIQ